MTMRIISGFSGRAPRPAAVAIGAFDGVHRGHAAVIGEAVTAGGETGATPTVATFEPLPREHFLGAGAPPRLTGFRDRVMAFAGLGVEQVCRLRFDSRFAALAAAEFVERVLVESLRASVVVVGEGFRFGHERAGDVATLEDLGARHGFRVRAVATLEDADGRVSSTRIRTALGIGDVAAANSMLGRRYSVSGLVRYGDGRGRGLGFPTANLVPARPLALADGVYATTVTCPGGAIYKGAAHWGPRTMLGGTERRLEVHLLDFDGDLYGRRVCVEFVRFVRKDRAFEGVEGLKRQMEADVIDVRDA